MNRIAADTLLVRTLLLVPLGSNRFRTATAGSSRPVAHGRPLPITFSAPRPRVQPTLLYYSGASLPPITYGRVDAYLQFLSKSTLSRAP